MDTIQAKHDRGAVLRRLLKEAVPHCTVVNHSNRKGEINYFLSKDNLTCKNQSFFDYFLSKEVLTSKNQTFSVTFFQRTI